ncbi:hypothetical protein SLW73_02510 [Glutamicibacter protophormiae]|uniref:hypothetical protein n=1 Tax=Glutamicibacter protophormiae TaxID=37930 RepID=UPI002A81B530|nr:hypothetical protein [Glutamicibacter protophormiae]WPR65232.1 hypothetical protein SLW72_02510 [Glutamicibacter protophormiae]WPR68729.1 hypothetical protein SLW73_02510 [Glutamicibacter protophormiae]
MSILEILEAHTLAYDWYPCSCGVKWVWDGRGSGTEQHRAHVAQVLEQHEREAKAAVLTDVADNLARESDQFATTAERLTGHDNTRYHAYSAARQSIAHQLRDRAAQLKETP